MGLKDIFSDPSKFKFYGGKGYPTPSSTVGGVGGKLPLLTLNYGNDRPGGGSSSQPFVQQSIPEGQIPFQSTTAGGINNIINNAQINTSAVGQDVERIGKWFTTTPGVIFIGKQNVLSQTNVRTQANNASNPDIIINGGPYTPTNTLAQIAGVNFGSHFFKQGLTPNGFRAPQYNSNETITEVTSVSTNRLILLKDSKITNIPNNNPLNSISPLPTEILRYRGGPDSILGIGFTSINFAPGSRTGINNPLYKSNLDYFYGILNKGSITNLPAEVLEQQKPYKNQPIVGLVDFRTRLRAGVDASSILSESPSYSEGNNKTIETRVNLGDPGKRNKNVISYTAGLGTALDKITAKPLYQSRLVNDIETTDLVKFRIEAIDNKSPGESVFMHFRAFLDTFTDNYNADWSSTQYVGRGEKFYNYNSFDRTINLGWTVAAQSKEELIPMYQKLNFLASNLMPDYNDQGYMRGSLVRITVGGYLYSQPGFLTSLIYDVPQESPWEIGINNIGELDNTVKELPHMIKVTATFTPIHTFVPRKQINQYSGSYGSVSSFGKERYIALSNGSNENYNNTSILPPTPINENQAAIDAINSINVLQSGTSLR
jgi:hypothetical protein